MTKEIDSVAKGVADAWDFWLANHDVSTPEVIQEAISEAFARWSSDREDELIQKISESIASTHPISGPPIAVYAVGSVVQVFGAKPGWDVIPQYPDGTPTGRFPVTAWASVVWRLDEQGRPQTRLQAMFITPSGVETQSDYQDSSIVKAGQK